MTKCVICAANAYAPRAVRPTTSKPQAAGRCAECVPYVAKLYTKTQKPFGNADPFCAPNARTGKNKKWRAQATCTCAFDRH